MAEPRLDGCVQFYIAAPPQQMKDWPVQAIKEFFDGLAMIVYAAGRNASVEVVHIEGKDHDR